MRPAEPSQVADDEQEHGSEQARPDAGPNLDALAARLGLEPSEVAMARIVIAAALDPDAPTPTVRSLLHAVPEAHLSSFAPDGALRSAGVVVSADRSLLHAPVGVDDRILLHLVGHDGPDIRLLPYVRPLSPTSERLPATRRRAAAIIGRVLDTPLDATCRIEVRGPDADDRSDVIALAAAASTRVGRAWLAAASELPRSPTERDAFARLWNREARLADAVLVIEADGVALDGELLARLDAPLILSTDTATSARSTMVVEVPRPSRAEQEQLWSASVTPASASSLAGRFDVSHTTIRETAGHPDAAEAVKTRLRHRLDHLAQRIDARAGWDDLVVSAAGRSLLQHLGRAAAGRRALAEAGIGAATARGQGLTALFTGPSGTGKTLAAEVIATSLDLDLYRVDLAATVSKWIGETEKHLRDLFDAAEAGGAVLLFDEADALFGKRSEVRDSHDRYANLEVSYLLQRMEDFRGVALLTTNMRTALDPAFLRRLSVVVPFAHPGLSERLELWRRALPPTVQGRGIDIERLSSIDLTGGQITSIARHAVLAAASGGGPLTMAIMCEAAAAELSKADRPLSELVGLMSHIDSPGVES